MEERELSTLLSRAQQLLAEGHVKREKLNPGFFREVYELYALLDTAGKKIVERGGAMPQIIEISRYVRLLSTF